MGKAASTNGVHTRLPATVFFCLLSLSAVFVAPLWILLLSPILLGVPHIASDIRYLVIQPYAGSRKRDLTFILAPIAGLLLLGALAAFGIPRQLTLETALGLTAVGVAITLGLSGGVSAAKDEGKKVFFLAALLGLSAILLNHPHQTLIALLHLHNFIAIAIWFGLFQASRTKYEGQAILLVLLLSTVAAAAIGFFVPNLIGPAGAPAGFGPPEAAMALLPGISLSYAAIVIRLYAFLQLMHYVIWLFLVPNSSASGLLVDDFGSKGLTTVSILSVVTVAAGMFLPLKTREVYLTASSFHAWLEVAVGTYLVLGMQVRTKAAPADLRNSAAIPELLEAKLKKAGET